MVEVDASFVRDIIKLGGKTLKLCYQCATCSVVCPISPDENPFPRKEMIWAQWGLKDRLLKDADIWLCHQCQDCSDYCPRGAKPGEVLAAIRAKVIEELAFPSFLAKALSRPYGIVLWFAIPIFFTLLYFTFVNPFKIPEGEVVLGKLIPHTHVEIAGFIMGAWIFIASAVGVWRFWNNISSEGIRVYEYEIKEGADWRVAKYSPRLIECLFWAIINILGHYGSAKFKECGKAKYRYYAHFLIFWGFLILGIATLGDIVYMYGFGVEELALPPTDPVKILGTIGAGMLIFGTLWAIVMRFADERIGYGTYFDWLFLATLFAVGVSGLATELLRYAGSVGAYYAYVIHLILVFTLLAYAPYSKFAHLLYRTLAYVWAKSVGREVTPTS